MSIKTAMIEALEKKYEADLARADATIKIYLESSVGIGEHPQHLEEVDKLIQNVADAEEKLRVLRQYRCFQKRMQLTLQVCLMAKVTFNTNNTCVKERITRNHILPGL